MECVANARWVVPPRRPVGIQKGPEVSYEDPRKEKGLLAWRRDDKWTC